jgi:hypothetical protein
MSSSDQGKAQNDVGASEILTTEIVSAIRRGSQLSLQEGKVGLQVGSKEVLLDFVRYAICDRFDEKWDR